MRFLTLFVGLCFLISFNTVHFTQRNQMSGIKGSIMDSFGALIPDATVTATGGDGKKYETKTKINGEYQLNIPNNDIYKIQVILRPFKAFTIDEYQLIKAGMLNLDVSLIRENCETLSLPFKSLQPLNNL